MDALEAIFRWMHVFAGIAWIDTSTSSTGSTGRCRPSSTAPRKARRARTDATRALLVPLGSSVYVVHKESCSSEWSITWASRRSRPTRHGRRAR